MKGQLVTTVETKKRIGELQSRRISLKPQVLILKGKRWNAAKDC